MEQIHNLICNPIVDIIIYMVETIGLYGQQEQMQEIPRPREQTKEKLSQRKVGRWLSALGSEQKAVVFILTGDGNDYREGILNDKILSAQGNEKGWFMSRSLAFNYCAKSFLPAGLVEEVFTSDFLTPGYRISKEGKKYGVAFAGFLLRFSEENNLPLNLFLGAPYSPSKEKNAPIITVKILHAIVDCSSLPMREIDVEDMIKEDSIHEHLERLSALGVIGYQTIEPNTRFAYYKADAKILEQEAPVYRTAKQLAGLVSKIFKQHKDRLLTIEEIYNFLPEDQKKTWERKSLFGALSNTLAFLSKKGFLKRGKFYNAKQSEVDITESQRKILIEFLTTIDEFENQDEEVINEEKLFAEEVILNPVRVANFLRRGREASRHANQLSFEENARLICNLISANSGSTNKQLQAMLREHGRSLTRPAVGNLTHRLTNKKRIQKVKKGNVNEFYSVI